jgi:hypothetical protein
MGRLLLPCNSRDNSPLVSTRWNGRTPTRNLTKAYLENLSRTISSLSSQDATIGQPRVRGFRGKGPDCFQIRHAQTCGAGLQKGTAAAFEAGFHGGSTPRREESKSAAKAVTIVSRPADVNFHHVGGVRDIKVEGWVSPREQGEELVAGVSPPAVGFLRMPGTRVRTPGHAGEDTRATIWKSHTHPGV